LEHAGGPNITSPGWPGSQAYNVAG